MKHVKEPLPDVQRLRPEISAALAAVVERATAKETAQPLRHRRRDGHDLEEVLGIEAARAGEATGEATTILRSLPGDTGDFAPERLRHPRRTLAIGVSRSRCVAGGSPSCTRTEKGAGGTVTRRPRAQRGAAGTERRRRLRPARATARSTRRPRGTPSTASGRPTGRPRPTRAASPAAKTGVGLYVDAGPPSPPAGSTS